MGVARRAVARLVGPVTARRRRSVVVLVGLLAGVVAAAWSATPVCACSYPAYEIYTPFGDLGAIVDYDGDAEEGDGPDRGPHGFTFSFLAPVILADSADPDRRDERDDLTDVWSERTGRAGRGLDLNDTTRPRLTDAAFLAALRAGALDRAVAEARANVARSLDMPAVQAQVEQGVVQRAVEFLELRPHLSAADGPRLARFFAAPPVPRDTPRVSYAYDSAAIAAARVRAWRRAQVARVPAPVPDESLPPALRDAAALRRLSRAELAAAAERLTASPRLPSLRFVALQERTRALIPPGWPSYDTTHADARATAVRSALRADYAAWLAAYPTHPLADLVRLSAVRAARVAGDTAAVWATLLAEYPRHRARVLAEMYYLLVAGFDPPAAARAAITDPLLRSAFAFYDFGCARFACSDGSAAGYDRARWNAEWRRAQAARPAAWAVNAQERLLRVALGDSLHGPLPGAFPAAPDAPTPLWGTLRLALLVRAERWADADAQAALLPATRPNAALRTRLALRRRAWSRALSEPELAPDTRRYVLQVLAPDSVLAAVAGAADTGARNEAVRARAARLAAAGDWAGASRTAAAVDPALAARLGAVGALAGDRSSAGRTAYARQLVDDQDSLLGGADERDWYRTVEYRWLRTSGDTAAGWGAPAAVPGVPWTPAEERAATRRFLLGNSELYFALGAYADALRLLPPAPAAAPRRRALARAADVPYNRLINRSYQYTVFWPRVLARDSNVATIRRAGHGR